MNGLPKFHLLSDIKKIFLEHYLQFRGECTEIFSQALLEVTESLECQFPRNCPVHSTITIVPRMSILIIQVSFMLCLTHEKLPAYIMYSVPINIYSCWKVSHGIFPFSSLSTAAHASWVYLLQWQHITILPRNGPSSNYCAKGLVSLSVDTCQVLQPCLFWWFSFW